ncbi:MAG TPA: nucleotide exchange factor GrpE [Vicinamibacteria bacterium]|nr:nucleotide exchange factor GrpE [Vicinamibacteria bacterium]
MKRGGGGEDDAPERPGAPVVDEPPEEEASGLTPVEPSASTGDVDPVHAERDLLKDRLLRKAAEFDNYRKRVERDRAQAGAEAAAAVLKALMPTLDNLERALQAEGDAGALRAGVELTYRDLLAALQAQGLVVEDPTGQTFDPTRHEALAHEEAAGFSEGDVVAVLRKGYSFKDRLLRPALVKVAKGVASETPTDKVH